MLTTCLSLLCHSESIAITSGMRAFCAYPRTTTPFNLSIMRHAQRSSVRWHTDYTSSLQSSTMTGRVIPKSESCMLYFTTYMQVYEMLQGDGFLSQGGSGHVIEQFQDLNLNGQKVLDIGCGIGGVDFVLAEQFDTDITAIDTAEDVVAVAKKKQQQHQNMKGRVQFEVVAEDATLSSFADNTFDVVFSKEVFVHLPSPLKQRYFDSIYRVLKPGGCMRIVDWLHATGEHSVDFKHMIELDDLPYHLITPEAYQALIAQSGFQVSFIDESEQYKAYCAQDVTRLETLKEAIVQRFGQAEYDTVVDSMALQYKIFESGEIKVGQLNALKPQTAAPE